MELAEFLEGIAMFDALSGNEQIAIVGWYLHVELGQETFGNADLRQAFRDAHREPPDVTVYLPRMVARRPPIVVKQRGGYRLSGPRRRALDLKYGQHPTVVAVTALLATLPQRVPDKAEKEFLSEALACYRVRAFRAATVMAWNLAFDHVRGWVATSAPRLAAFNAAISKRYPKSGVTVGKADDFESFTEAEVIEICYTARLISKNITDILREKLKRRNIAAHPSNVVVTQHQADDTITDLVNNVVLALM